LNNRHPSSDEFDEKEDNSDPDDETAKTFSSDSKDHKPQQEQEDNTDIFDLDASTTSNRPNVAEKVREDTIPNISPLDDDDTHRLGGNNNKSLSKSKEVAPEDLVRDWESLHPDKKLKGKARAVALLAASLHLYEGRGITVQDLTRLGNERDNAERKIYLCKEAGLLVPHETLKIGKQTQYFLSNYKYIIDMRNKEDIEIQSDKDLILQLFRILSSRKYKAHDIHMQTILNYKDDYNLIPWNIPSLKNKQKVKIFKLEPRRKCSITVSPTGTVDISIECTLQSYDFHTASDLVIFIGACGEVARELKAATLDRTNVVPVISEWWFTQLEFNKDVPANDPNVVSWAPVNGRLKIKYLGVIFQIYPKGLPELGDCTRFENRFTTKKKVNMVDTLADIVSEDQDEEAYVKKSPFVTAEELFKKKIERMELEDREDETFLP
jgi:hypothetical protein